MSIRDTPWPDGTPCWVDLLTTDPDAAKAFYAELFGWQWSPGEEKLDNYSNASLGGKLVAGMPGSPATDHPSVWGTYLATGDAAATCDAAVRAGGNLVMPAMDVAGLGSMAMLQDAHRGTFGVWQAGSHTGTQRVNEHGSLVWTEFITRDYDEAKEFFAAIFSYTYDDIGDNGMLYSLVKVDGNVVGGLGAMHDDVPPQMPPYFGIYFCVDNCDDAVDHAVKLGGTLVRPAMDMPFGRHAGLADPTGATFSVITPPAG